MTIEDGKFVKIEYVGTLDDGTVFDSTGETGEPLEFQLGGMQVIPGFETAIKDMKLNEERNITIPAEEAYGEPREDLIIEFPRSEVPEGEEVVVGQKIVVTTDMGQPFPATVLELTDEIIKIDVNHPLAGKTLHFKLKVVDINDTGSDNCSSGCSSCSSCD